MKVIIPCKFLQTIHSKAKENKESCTYHSVLCDLDAVLIKDKDNKFTCDTPMKDILLECYANVYNGKIFLTLIRCVE